MLFCSALLAAPSETLVKVSISLKVNDIKTSENNSLIVIIMIIIGKRKKTFLRLYFLIIIAIKITLDNNNACVMMTR